MAGRSDTGRPLKVGLICDWYLPKVGGIELHVQDLAYNLAARGHAVKVLTPMPGNAEMNGIPVHRLKVPWYGLMRFAWDPGTYREIASVLKQDNYDVIHCHAGYMTIASYGGAYLSHKLQIPAVITFHSILGRFARVLGYFDRPFCWSDWCLVFSAVSRAVACDIESIVRPRPVYILPNAVDPSKWVSMPAWRDPAEFRIVSVFRMTPRKRGRAMIRIIRRVCEYAPPGIKLKAVLIGDGLQRRSIEELVRRWDLQDVVQMTGLQDREQIKGHLSRADVFVQPTFLEAFGIAALEARCAGLPIVAMHGTGTAEFIRDGREGLLAGSDEDMVAKIVRLMRSPELRMAMAQNNKTNTPPHSWDELIPRHLDVYREAIRLRNVFRR